MKPEQCKTCGNYPAKCRECGANADIYDHFPCYKHCDVIRVVRCKDCVYFKQHDDLAYCDRPSEGRVARFPDDYCSSARRKKGEQYV